MEWIKALNNSIDFMENHLLEDITIDDIAREVNMSPFYYQKAFKILTGYAVGEYLRNRRLSLAGAELTRGNAKIIDVAYTYGYETPESFSKAFRRFHGVSPQLAKQKEYQLHDFQRLIIKVIIQGGSKMDCRIEKKEAFKIVGRGREFSYDNSYQMIPKFWDEFCKKYCKVENPSSKGIFGICLDIKKEGGTFQYLIADPYEKGPVPEGFKIMEIPSFTWAIFTCKGPLPEALQSVNTRIFSEWLPTNGEYEIATGISIEMYTMGDTTSKDYISEIWIPVKPKK
ncbi:MAG: AraC family transcriptional regulator [Sphaerochaetaceae bacterium]